MAGSPLYKIFQSAQSLDETKAWLNFKDLLKYPDSYQIQTIDIATAEHYRHDLYGLFKDVFNIDDEYIYIHVLVNGFNSIIDYNGDRFAFKIINPSALREIGTYKF